MAGVRRSLRVVPKGDTFASLLASRRSENSQTQADVAELIGVRQQTIAAWERGDRPQPRFFPALASYLSVQDETILRRLLDLTPAAVTDQQSSEPEKTSLALYNTLAESFAARSRMGPMSTGETALFTELLAHYRDSERSDNTQEPPG